MKNDDAHTGWAEVSDYLVNCNNKAEILQYSKIDEQSYRNQVALYSPMDMKFCAITTLSIVCGVIAAACVSWLRTQLGD